LNENMAKSKTMGSSPKKPQYQKILVSREFPTRVQAEEFASETKGQYKDAGESIKYDIRRTSNTQWEAVVYQKV
jgi:hypothetical protein